MFVCVWFSDQEHVNYYCHLKIKKANLFKAYDASHKTTKTHSDTRNLVCIGPAIKCQISLPFEPFDSFVVKNDEVPMSIVFPGLTRQVFSYHWSLLFHVRTKSIFRLNSFLIRRVEVYLRCCLGLWTNLRTTAHYHWVHSVSFPFLLLQEAVKLKET